MEQGQHQLSLGNVHFPGLQELGREAPSSAPFPNVPGTGVAAILQGAVPAGLTYPPFAVTATEATAPAALSTFAAAAGFAPFAPFAPFAAGAAPTASAAHAPASFFIPGAPMPRQQLLSYPSLARPGT